MDSVAMWSSSTLDFMYSVDKSVFTIKLQIYNSRAGEKEVRID
jgi:hypothetical protein